MKKRYKTELEAMRDFWDESSIKLCNHPKKDGCHDDCIDYSCNTDGRVSGTLVEIKLNNSGGLPLKQLKRYIKSYNSIAKPLPHYSLFININQREFTFIDNSNWKIITDGKWKQPKDLLTFLNKKDDDDYIKGWINEYSIVKYNDLFYSKHLSAKKEDFIEEIKNPKELNIKPYHWNGTGDMERSILDCLGSNELKKRLGAFFTPDEYVEISTKYIRNAIGKVPKDYDYIILDRCAGTGNLEKFLTNEELEHCVLNTYVYAEWTTLKGLYEDRARHIIPHTRDNKDSDGLLSDGDALKTKEFINNPIIKKYIDDPKCIVIMLENPPYSLANPDNRKGGIKGTFVSNKMAGLNLLSTAKQDMVTAFIWSAYEFYKPDFYILYAPIKYWKHTHLIDKKYIKGYLCNKKHFHATESAISLIMWKNKNVNNNSLILDSDIGNKKVIKSHTPIVNIAKQIRKSSDEKNCIGTWLSTRPNINYMGNGFYQEAENNGRNQIPLSEKNILISLPIFVANCYKPKDYTEKEVIMKSGDGGTKYQKNKAFLNDCFVWTCLTNSNKCISNKQIKNELCLSQNTKTDKLLDINGRNTKLLQKWREVLELVKKTKEYNPKFTYGLHQICREINIKVETGDYNKRHEPIMEYKYSDLNDTIKELKEQLKEFYNKYITPNLFKYELLK